MLEETTVINVALIVVFAVSVLLLMERQTASLKFLRTVRKDRTTIYIGLCGLAGAGKDTVADMLAEELRQYGRLWERALRLPQAQGVAIVRDSFAAPIYRMLEAIDVTYHTREEKEQVGRFPFAKHASWRRFAVTLGTEWGRDLIDPDLWVNLLLHRNACNLPRIVIVSDVRKLNEATALSLSDNLSCLVYISRPGVAAGSHSSERFTAAVYTSLQGAELEGRRLLVLPNAGSKEELRRGVKLLAQHILRLE